MVGNAVALAVGQSACAGFGIALILCKYILYYTGHGRFLISA